MRGKEGSREGKRFKSPQMIPDKHPETFDSPSLPRRSGGAVTALLSSAVNSLAANILNYLANMLPGKRESSAAPSKVPK